MTSTHAPGAPGIAPTWTRSLKQGIGTSLRTSRVWFTIGQGIVNEVFYPHVDTPQIRDLGFIVADGDGFWYEVKRNEHATIEPAAPGVAAYTVTHRHDRFTLVLRVTSDPHRDVVAMEARLEGDEALRLYALLAPNLRGRNDNRAWIGRHGAWKTLSAQTDGIACALLAAHDGGADAWRRMSCGFVGVSDGWQDFAKHARLEWTFAGAGPGNVAVIGELSPAASVRLALGFGGSDDAASTIAAASLASPFDELWQTQIDDWTKWHHGMLAGRSWRAEQLPSAVRSELTTSAMVLKTHQDKEFLGATVASLSTPWGQSRNDAGGYHLVWPRDLVEAAGGMLALGDVADARNVLEYLIATQEPDGHWTQNQWLSGRPYWNGIQLDEVGLPILLAAAVAERRAADGLPVAGMVRRAASFIARHGPVTPQDRWESDAGLNPFTLAVIIAALVCAAEFLDDPARSYALELADTWNAHVEKWTYATNTPIAQRVGIEGHYLRSAPPPAVDPGFDLSAWTREGAPSSRLLGLECLALVRYGLRRSDDPRIVNTTHAADAILRVQTPSGSVWRRYPDDRYGEHEDGAPYDGDGIGRAWPLLTGERGHYAIATGHDPSPYLETMIRVAPHGMIPEQVWDGDPIPSRHLFPGKPSGSATPLVWAHAEFVKLCWSAVRGEFFDRPQAVVRRYGDSGAPPMVRETWRFDQPCSSVERGRELRIEVAAPALVRYSVDDWASVHDVNTSDSGLGLHTVDVATRDAAAQRVAFTFRWAATGAWEGKNFVVAIGS